MQEAVWAVSGRSRKSLYHFTRLVNVPAVAALDRLLSSSRLCPDGIGERRARAAAVRASGYEVVLNAHLRIPDGMLDPATTQEQFRATLDAHVFFWPTRRDCRSMLNTYEKREPGERFAVLEFDAYSLLTRQPDAVRLSKYDSGSAPRFPHLCGYRKSPAMFLPLRRFRHELNSLVPVKAAEIREVLIVGEVPQIGRQLTAVYLDEAGDLPESWTGLWRPLAELRGGERGNWR
ncbi:hypothetical protein B5M42_003585 [Paenibacillus athensensis]|uniref:DarT domain-containing protein n=1 Tax=Paenibacillus athensensis TaxID=1967502 RepID=A0A4Y8PTI6_9BACL|nr:hypothetical protein [Paenibacillus athensensis]MCD1257923.1 hypothetical protein [Paenibacillus athensensis]